MEVYSQVYKAFIDSRKNNFWDAWGIVVSPIAANKLRAECLERIVVGNTEHGIIDEIFGLKVIPCCEVEKEKVYIVDEKLGHMILGQTKGEANDRV